MNLSLSIIISCFLFLSCNHEKASPNQQLQAKDSTSLERELEERNILPPFKSISYLDINAHLEQDYLGKSFKDSLPHFLKYYKKRLPNISVYESYYLSIDCHSASASKYICPEENLSYALLVLYDTSFKSAYVINVEYDFLSNSKNHTMSFAFKEDTVIVLSEKIKLKGKEDRVVAEHSIYIFQDGMMDARHSYSYIQKPQSGTNNDFTLVDAETSAPDVRALRNNKAQKFLLPPIEYLKFLEIDTKIERDYIQHKAFEDSLFKYLKYADKKWSSWSGYELYRLVVDCYQDSISQPICPVEYSNGAIEPSFSLLILYEPSSKAAYVIISEYQFYVDAQNLMDSHIKNDTLYLTEEIFTEDGNGLLGSHVLWISQDGTINISNQK